MIVTGIVKAEAVGSWLKSARLGVVEAEFRKSCRTRGCDDALARAAAQKQKYYWRANRKRQGAKRQDTMNRNVLYLVIGLLAAGVVIVGYLYYQESRSGITIELGEQGLTIEEN